jgi:hypothetical protein
MAFSESSKKMAGGNHVCGQEGLNRKSGSRVAALHMGLH